MKTRTILAGASVSIFLTAGSLAAALTSGEAQDSRKTGPPWKP
jgi:hypothetical protein